MQRIFAKETRDLLHHCQIANKRMYKRMCSNGNVPLDGRRILIAEDEPLIALDIANTLTTAGAEIVGQVRSVNEAIQLTNSERFHCAVLDIILRDGDVYPVAEALHPLKLAHAT